MIRLILLCSAICIAQAFIFGNRARCYGKYGCFNNDSPYTNSKGKLPQSPADQNIRFFLYTRKNTYVAEVLKEFLSIKRSHFNSHKKTVFIVHGYQDSGQSSWVKKMMSEILKFEDANVVVVHWEKGADYINYFQAVSNTRVVGAAAAQLIHDMHTETKISYSKFHIVGHSLGSHIAGYIGERVPGMGRITGLDPAGLAFEKYDPKVRLDASDAVYVDVIHTDAETLAQLAFGMIKAIGHTDFYPNGGRDQPGCPHLGNHALDLITGQIDKLKGNVGCSHMRAVDLFTASINSKCKLVGNPCSSDSQFKSGKCNSCGNGCATMGYHSTSPHRGSYYLKTTSSTPFCT